MTEKHFVVIESGMPWGSGYALDDDNRVPIRFRTRDEADEYVRVRRQFYRSNPRVSFWVEERA